jgi:uncharacterized coiled-coil protein SlyX
MNNGKEALEIRLADIKRQIAAQEAVLQDLWLTLLEVYAKLAVARRDHDYDPQ